MVIIHWLIEWLAVCFCSFGICMVDKASKHKYRTPYFLRLLPRAVADLMRVVYSNLNRRLRILKVSSVVSCNAFHQSIVIC